jgi:hypothetical protein
MVIDNLDIERVAIAELEANTPAGVDRHRPLPFACALQFMQPNAPQRAQILKRLGNIQSQEQIDGHLDIEPAKLI